ncbi:MAG: hypothetical protein E6Q97_02315 [Desulfurellales bacterium]|nr:MAG: hypothetical protein E6Q97_02315 [Desulfurellales bacterium]
MKRIFAFAGLILALTSPALAECEKFTVPYAGTAIMQFCLWEPDGTGFKVDASCESSTDNLIIKDQAAQTTSENCFVDEGSCYSITIDATDTTVKTGTIMLVDDDNLWLDKCITYLTYGHASSYFGASVKADVVAALTTDTYGELSAVPGSTPTILEMLQWVYQLMKFKLTQTSTTATAFKDNGSTPLGTSTTSDDGSTFTRGEYN